MNDLYDEFDFPEDEAAFTVDQAGAPAGSALMDFDDEDVLADDGDDRHHDDNVQTIGWQPGSRRNVVIAALACLSVGGILLIALGGFSALLGWGQSLLSPVPDDEMSGGSVAPTAIVAPAADVTSTPLPTPTQLAPLPTPTQPPPPVMLEISAPEVIPGGMPSRAQWRIRLREGDMVTVAITDLGGALLDTDERGDALVERPLAMGHLITTEDWTIDGVLEPNVGNSALEITVSSPDGTGGVVSLPWTVADVARVQYAGSEHTLSGTSVDGREQSDGEISEENGSSPGMKRYEGLLPITFEYPDSWIVNDTAGVVVVASNSDLLIGGYGEDTGGAYLEIAMGDAAMLGAGNVRAMLEQLVDRAGANTVGAVTVGDIEQTTLGASGEMATVIFSGIDTVAGSFVGEMGVIMNDDAIFIAQSMTTEGEDALVTLQEIVRTIAFSDGSVAAGS